MKKLVVLLSLFLLFLSCKEDLNISKYKIVAHRGYWKAAEGAQNSIRALNEAVRLGVEGVELDVRTTKENIPILHHDAIAGDFVVVESHLSEIKTLRLPDGTLVPTLEEYLAQANKYQKLELYIDVKTSGSIMSVIDMILKYELENRVILLTSFDMGLEAIAYNEDIKVHCMTNEKIPLELKEKGFSGIGFDIEYLKRHLDCIKQAHSVGLQVGCWVVKSESEIIWCSLHDINYVITDSPLECKQYLYQ